MSCTSPDSLLHGNRLPSTGGSEARPRGLSLRRLFSYNKSESVKTVLLGLGRLNITHFIMLRKIDSIGMFLSENNVLLTILCHF